MKKFITILLAFIISLAAYSQKSVGYTYRPLADEGCSVRYSVLLQDSVKYIVVTVKSDRLQYSAKPVLMLKNGSGEVIKLEGMALRSSSESMGIVSGNVVIPVTELSATAQFPITDQQIEMIKDGVFKVRLSTVPIMHEREFAKDKIGKKLYTMLSKLNNSEEEF